MNCCDYGCNQSAHCPAHTQKVETRGQALAAERKWGEMPIQMLGSEPDTDELITRDFIYGAVFAICGVVIGVAIGAAIYFK